MKTFGELLRQHRVAADLSQEKLAYKAQLSVESVGSLERGSRRAPYRATVRRLSEALALSMQEYEALESAAARARSRPDRIGARPDRTTPDNNLPPDISSLIGRDEAVLHVVSLYKKHRLITITGSGGVGKTRVAIETGRRFLAAGDHEVWFVDLASLSDGTLIPGKIAAALGPPIASQVNSLESLSRALAPRRALLIIDNCEHLIGEVAGVATDLLRTCPRIAILATSRERLSNIGEAIYRLPSLDVPAFTPGSARDALACSAIDLFHERATSGGQTLSLSPEAIDSMVDICRRLDGIPLAIELAVGRLPLLGLSGLRSRLEESFSLAGAPRNIPMRQQTVTATITWSFNLLNEQEQAILRRLAIFAGGFTISAAEAVCRDPELPESAVLRLISSLFDKSLVTLAHEREPLRYRLLDSVRSFGLEKLAASGEASIVSRRHAEWLAGLADLVRTRAIIEPSMYKDAAFELDNARAALSWCRTAPAPQDRALAMRIILGLRGLWELSSKHAELERLCIAALENVNEEEHPMDVAVLLGIIIGRSFALPHGREAIERAIPLYERIGQPKFSLQFYSMLTLVYAELGELLAAKEAAQRATSIAEQGALLDSIYYADLLASRSRLRLKEQRFEDAREDLAAACAIAQRLANTYYVITYCTPRLAEVEFKAGNLPAAVALAESMLSSEHGSTGQVAVEALELIATIRLHLGDVAAADAAASRLLLLARGDETLAIEYLATSAAIRGQSQLAARLKGFVDALLKTTPMLGLFHQRTSDLLSASLAAQLSASTIDREVAVGASFTLERATAEALASV